jgi:hypothetical protein
MDPAIAEVLSSLADALAAIAVFVALSIAIADGSDPNKAEIRPSVAYLAAFGIIIFVAGRTLRYHVAG